MPTPKQKKQKKKKILSVVRQQPLSVTGTVQQRADLYPFDFHLWIQLKTLVYSTPTASVV